MQNSRFSEDKSVENMSMLTSFDLGALEDMDPSLSKFFIFFEFELKKTKIIV